MYYFSILCIHLLIVCVYYTKLFCHKILTFIGFKKHSYFFYIPYLPLVLPGGQQTSQGSIWLSLTCRPLDACCFKSNSSSWATEKVPRPTLSTLFPATFSSFTVLWTCVVVSHAGLFCQLPQSLVFRHPLASNSSVVSVVTKVILLHSKSHSRSWTWFSAGNIIQVVRDLRSRCNSLMIRLAEDMILVHVPCQKWRCVSQSLTQGIGVNSRSVTVLLKLALCCQHLCSIMLSDFTVHIGHFTV